MAGAVVPLGLAPAQDKQARRNAETFKGLAKAYLEVAEKRHRSWKEEKRTASGGGAPDQARRLLSPRFRHLARDLSRGGAIAVVCQVVGQKISFPSISVKHSAAVNPR